MIDKIAVFMLAAVLALGAGAALAMLMQIVQFIGRLR
jgi:hypothetical protein